jgi:hypothetical protein
MYRGFSFVSQNQDVTHMHCHVCIMMNVMEGETWQQITCPLYISDHSHPTRSIFILLMQGLDRVQTI